MYKSIQDAMSLMSSLHMLNRVHNGPDFDKAINLLKQYVEDRPQSFRGKVIIHEYPSGAEINYWRVPQKWTVHKGRLLDKKGNVIISSDLHPLVITPFSDSFTGELSREELAKHIYFRDDLPAAIPYIFRKQYRHWEKGWGIAMPRDLFETLKDDVYRVEIETDFSPAPMKLFEYYVQGTSDETYFLCGHLDHPGQANDSISGCVGSLETVRMVEENLGTPYYSYRVIICPEIVGSAIYLFENPDLPARAVGCLCPNMLGHPADFAFCYSKSQVSMLDAALHHSLTLRKGKKFFEGPFRKYPDCGDEISFDAPGLDIPTVTLSRVGELFKHYHTSFDDLIRFQPELFAESIDIMGQAFLIAEKNYIPKRTFTGNPCLANPRFNLYLEPKNISNLYNKGADMPELLDIANPGKIIDPRLFMDYFLSNLEGNVSLVEIAEGFSVSFDFVRNYAEQFFAHGLIKKIPAHNNLVQSHLVKTSDQASGFLFTERS